MSKISIVIPAYNEEKYIWKCIENITKYAKWVHEIIVIDNASTDSTAEIVKKFDNVKYIYEPKKWLTQARQTWYQNATWDIIAYIDSDSNITESWFAKVEKNFEDKKIGFLSGPYYYYDAGIMNHIWSFFYWVFLGYAIYLVVWYLWIGGNMIFRKSVLDQMWWFDTSIEFYGEDTNAARRASQFAKCKFDLTLIMPTSARRLSKQWFRKTVYIYVINFVSEVVHKKPHTSEYEDFR